MALRCMAFRVQASGFRVSLRQPPFYDHLQAVDGLFVDAFSKA